MKVFQKRSVAAAVMVLAIAAGILLGQARKPEGLGQASTAVVGTYTYVYDYAGVLTDKTMTYIDEMNTSLFAQTGAQIMVQTVDSTDGTDIVDYAANLGARYGVGSAERDNGLVLVLALEDLADNGLVGNYGIAGGDGLYKYGNELTSMLYVYMEEDFAAGDYDAAVRKTVKAYMDWFADLYGVTVRENYIPAVAETFSAGSGYETVSTGYFDGKSEEEIRAYLETEEPMDKAGAYAVQGKGSALIESISGDFFAVMGLPASSTARSIKEFGIVPNNI